MYFIYFNVHLQNWMIPQTEQYQLSLLPHSNYFHKLGTLKVADEPLLISSMEDEIECLIDKKRVRSTIFYLVQWKNKPIFQSTWEEIGNLEGCSYYILQFQKKEKTATCNIDKDSVFPLRPKNKTKTQIIDLSEQSGQQAEKRERSRDDKTKAQLRREKNEEKSKVSTKKRNQKWNSFGYRKMHKKPQTITISFEPNDSIDIASNYSHDKSRLPRTQYRLNFSPLQDRPMELPVLFSQKDCSKQKMEEVKYQMSALNFEQSRKSLELKKRLDSHIERMTGSKMPSYHTQLARQISKTMNKLAKAREEEMKAILNEDCHLSEENVSSKSPSCCVRAQIQKDGKQNNIMNGL